MKDKIILRKNIEKKIKSLKHEKKKIVFTNGCFDILHPGHVEYLRKAKSFGDLLIVGVNSDQSIGKLKGSNRPINNWKSRTKVLEGLESVDYIVNLSENDPIKLIEKIKPDIHVKGGDYEAKSLLEHKTVLENGGKVKIVKFVKGYSTTTIIDRIKN